MSQYTTIEIKTGKIRLDIDTMQYLKDVTSSFWFKFEDKTDVIKEDYLEYYIAFNHGYDKALNILKLIEKCLIPEDKAIRIGNFYNEGFYHMNGGIYSYKNNVFIIIADYDNHGFVQSITYHVYDSQNGHYSFHTYEEIEEYEKIIECAKNEVRKLKKATLIKFQY